MAEDELRDAAGGRGAGNNAKPSYLDEPVATIHLEKAGKTGETVTPKIPLAGVAVQAFHPKLL